MQILKLESGISKKHQNKCGVHVHWIEILVGTIKHPAAKGTVNLFRTSIYIMVVLSSWQHGNIKPDKKITEKIDGVVATMITHNKNASHNRKA